MWQMWDNMGLRQRDDRDEVERLVEKKKKDKNKRIVFKGILS